MRLEIIVAFICLCIDGVLLVYNQFYFKEAVKANEQIGIPFHPLLVKYIQLNMILIALAAFITFCYFIVLLFR